MQHTGHESIHNAVSIIQAPRLLHLENLTNRTPSDSVNSGLHLERREGSKGATILEAILLSIFLLSILFLNEFD